MILGLFHTGPVVKYFDLQHIKFLTSKGKAFEVFFAIPTLFSNFSEMIYTLIWDFYKKIVGCEKIIHLALSAIKSNLPKIIL